jgi:WD40 repeat protein
VPCRVRLNCSRLLFLVCLGLAFGCAKRHPPPKGLELATLETEYAVERIVCSRDGSMLAIVGGNTAMLWNLKRNQQICTCRTNATWLVCGTFSPDGSKLAVGGGTAHAELWDTATGARLASFSGHTSEVRAVVFSTDGKTLFTAGSDQMVWCWDLSTNQGLPVINVQMKTIRGMAFSPDAKLLGVIDYDSKREPWTWNMSVWDIQTKTEKARVINMPSADCIALSHTGKRIATGNKGCEIRLWDLDSMKDPIILAKQRSQWPIVQSLAFSHDEQTLAAGGIDPNSQTGLVVLWDLNTLTEELNIQTSQVDTIYSLSFSCDDLLLFTGDRQGYVKEWELAKLLRNK